MNNSRDHPSTAVFPNKVITDSQVSENPNTLQFFMLTPPYFHICKR